MGGAHISSKNTVSHSKSSSNISNIQPVDPATWKSKSPTNTAPGATYAQGDYPQTFPGTKRDPHSMAPSATQLPVHLKYSATNQLATGQAPRPQDFNTGRLSQLASNSSSSSKSNKPPKMISSKLAKLSSTNSSSSKKPHYVV